MELPYGSNISTEEDILRQISVGEDYQELKELIQELDDNSFTMINYRRDNWKPNSYQTHVALGFDATGNPVIVFDGPGVETRRPEIENKVMFLLLPISTLKKIGEIVIDRNRAKIKRSSFINKLRNFNAPLSLMGVKTISTKLEALEQFKRNQEAFYPADFIIFLASLIWARRGGRAASMMTPFDILFFRQMLNYLVRGNPFSGNGERHEAFDHSSAPPTEDILNGYMNDKEKINKWTYAINRPFYFDGSPTSLGMLYRQSAIFFLNDRLNLYVETVSNGAKCPIATPFMEDADALIREAWYSNRWDETIGFPIEHWDINYVQPPCLMFRTNYFPYIFPGKGQEFIETCFYERTTNSSVNQRGANPNLGIHGVSAKDYIDQSMTNGQMHCVGSLFTVGGLPFYLDEYNKRNHKGEKRALYINQVAFNGIVDANYLQNSIDHGRRVNNLEETDYRYTLELAFKRYGWLDIFKEKNPQFNRDRRFSFLFPSLLDVFNRNTGSIDYVTFFKRFGYAHLGSKHITDKGFVRYHPIEIGQLFMKKENEETLRRLFFPARLESGETDPREMECSLLHNGFVYRHLLYPDWSVPENERPKVTGYLIRSTVSNFKGDYYYTLTKENPNIFGAGTIQSSYQIRNWDWMASSSLGRWSTVIRKIVSDAAANEIDRYPNFSLSSRSRDSKVSGRKWIDYKLPVIDISDNVIYFAGRAVIDNFKPNGRFVDKEGTANTTTMKNDFSLSFAQETVINSGAFNNVPFTLSGRMATFPVMLKGANFFNGRGVGEQLPYPTLHQDAVKSTNRNQSFRAGWFNDGLFSNEILFVRVIRRLMKKVFTLPISGRQTTGYTLLGDRAGIFGQSLRMLNTNTLPGNYEYFGYASKHPMLAMEPKFLVNNQELFDHLWLKGTDDVGGINKRLVDTSFMNHRDVNNIGYKDRLITSRVHRHYNFLGSREKYYTNFLWTNWRDMRNDSDFGQPFATINRQLDPDYTSTSFSFYPQIIMVGAIERLGRYGPALKFIARRNHNGWKDSLSLFWNPVFKYADETKIIIPLNGTIVTYYNAKLTPNGKKPIFTFVEPEGPEVFDTEVYATIEQGLHSDRIEFFVPYFGRQGGYGVYRAAPGVNQVKVKISKYGYVEILEGNVDRVFIADPTHFKRLFPWVTAAQMMESNFNVSFAPVPTEGLEEKVFVPAESALEQQHVPRLLNLIKFKGVVADTPYADDALLKSGAERKGVNAKRVNEMDFAVVNVDGRNPDYSIYDRMPMKLDDGSFGLTMSGIKSVSSNQYTMKGTEENRFYLADMSPQQPIIHFVSNGAKLWAELLEERKAGYYRFTVTGTGTLSVWFYIAGEREAVRRMDLKPGFSWTQLDYFPVTFSDPKNEGKFIPKERFNNSGANKQYQGIPGFDEKNWKRNGSGQSYLSLGDGILEKMDGLNMWSDSLSYSPNFRMGSEVVLTSTVYSRTGYKFKAGGVTPNQVLKVSEIRPRFSHLQHLYPSDAINFVSSQYSPFNHVRLPVLTLPMSSAFRNVVAIKQVGDLNEITEGRKAIYEAKYVPERNKNNDYLNRAFMMSTPDDYPAFTDPRFGDHYNNSLVVDAPYRSLINLSAYQAVYFYRFSVENYKVDVQTLLTDSAEINFMSMFGTDADFFIFISKDIEINIDIYSGSIRFNFFKLEGIRNRVHIYIDPNVTIRLKTSRPANTYIVNYVNIQSADMNSNEVTIYNSNRIILDASPVNNRRPDVTHFRYGTASKNIS